MPKRNLLAALVLLVSTQWACGDPPLPISEEEDAGDSLPAEGGSDAGPGDAGSDADAGTPVDAGPPADAGTPADAGLGDAGPGEAGPGPWPDEPVVDYSRRYGVPPVQSLGVDEAYNLWLLDGDRIGVLRPGDSAPRWSSGIGQAAPGFGPDKLALGSTVICGGAPGRAYVGYATYDLDSAFIYSPDGRSFPGYDDPDPSRFSPARYREYQKGDLDIVRLLPDGRVVLEEHMSRSARPNGPQDVGIRNTNDHHFDEDRSVLTCLRVMRGRHRGELYIGTNHGVTRIRGLVYNSHRHPIWLEDNGSQMTGYNYALGIALNGDVLIANEWKVGVVTPSESLADWDFVDPRLNPEKLNAHVHAVNSLQDMDFWRGFQQAADGEYYLASLRYGLWQMYIVDPSAPRATRVPGLPTDHLLSLAATDDGSVFIGTEGFGLWRLDAQKRLAPVTSVRGAVVRELLYDPTVQPAMLYVLTDAGVFVLRGH